MYARKNIATLRRARLGITIAIRWCLVHKGVPGNEKADKWAKLTEEEPGARRVEWLQYSGRWVEHGQCRSRYPSHTSSGRCQADGLEGGSPSKKYKLPTSQGRIGWWPAAPRG